MAIPVSEIKDKVTSKITRGHLDKVFTLVMLGNSVFAVVSAVLFILSSWWIFILLGTLGFPFLVGGFLLFKYTRFREPIQKYAINFVVKIYEGIVQRRAAFLRRIYTAVCWFVPRNEWKHINWGYAKLNHHGNSIEHMEELDEEKRFYIQLYHYLATGLGNWNSLEGKNVLELRAGGGGGIDAISRYLGANLCIGVDASTTQTEAARKGLDENTKLRFYTSDTLESFSQLDQLKDERVDLALSVQGSMFVRDLSNFIQEVDKVLRPGGFFAVSDIRLAEDWKDIERELQSSSMRIMKKENITNNVIMALKLDEAGKWKIISKKFGSIARRIVKRIGIVKNNTLAESLNRGNNVAMAYLLHKPPQAQVY